MTPEGPHLTFDDVVAALDDAFVTKPGLSATAACPNDDRHTVSVRGFPGKRPLVTCDDGCHTDQVLGRILPRLGITKAAFDEHREMASPTLLWPKAPPNKPTQKPSRWHGKPLAIVRATDVTESSVDWLWEERIPFGSLTMVEGHEGLGKSLFTQAIAAAVTTGSALPGDVSRREPASVLLLHYEDNPSTTGCPRARAAGADLSRVLFLNIGEDDAGALRDLKSAEAVAELEAVILREGIRLVVIDPLIEGLGLQKVNDEGKVREALAPLCDLAMRLQVALVAIRHFRKEPGGNSRAASAGSMAFGARARARIQLWPYDHGRAGVIGVVAWEKLTDADKPSGFEYSIVDGPEGPRFLFGQQTVVTTRELAMLEVERQATGADQLQERSALPSILAMIPPEGISRADLSARAESTGISTWRFSEALKAGKLANQLVVERTGKNGLGTVHRVDEIEPETGVPWLKAG